MGEASEVFGNQVSFVKSLNLGLELVQRAGQMDRRERRAGEKDPDSIVSVTVGTKNQRYPLRSIL